MLSDLDIIKNIEQIFKNIEKINKNVILVAVTKTVPTEKILVAYNTGIRYFGESKIQEALPKIEILKDKNDLNWHFIGHLQSNKVKKAVDNFSLIQSVDSLQLAEKISEVALSESKIIDVLIELNISNEKAKFGFLKENFGQVLEKLKELKGIKIKGLMTIAPYFEDANKARPYFKEMKRIFDEIAKSKIENIEMEYLSMGMTNDYLVAMEEGANMIRIGTGIFGKRNY